MLWCGLAFLNRDQVNYQFVRAPKYTETLQQHLIPTAGMKFPDGHYIFQQDNASCHKAKLTKEFLQNNGIQVMEWPPYSPDLNPIENLWAILKQKLSQEGYSNRNELITNVRRIWTEDCDIQRHCRTLSDSLSNRIRKCIRNKGGPINY